VAELHVTYRDYRPVVAVVVCVARQIGGNALSTAAGESRGIIGAIAISGDTHRAAIAQYQAYITGTTAFDSVVSVTARCTDVRTSSVVVVARVTACKLQPTLFRYHLLMRNSHLRRNSTQLNCRDCERQ